MKTIYDIDNVLKSGKILHEINKKEREIYIPCFTNCKLEITETEKPGLFNINYKNLHTKGNYENVLDFCREYEQDNCPKEKKVEGEAPTDTTFCMCCGKIFPIKPLCEQPLCNKCYPVAVKMLFSGIYDDLTAKEFRNAVRNKVLEAVNETGK